jgi:hypothetical protein
MPMAGWIPSAALAAFALAGASCAQGAALDTVATGPRPDEGVSFVSACRADLKDNDRFSMGYCQGFIASKLGRLSKARWDAIEARLKRSKGQTWTDSSPLVDVFLIIRSARFNDENFGRLARRFDRPVRAEDVLDYILDNILYAAER